MLRIICAVVLVFVWAAPLSAQQAPPVVDHSQHQHPVVDLFPANEGSGTALLPMTTPMYGVHRDIGGWSMMFHGNLFGQLLHETGERGDTEPGSINWVMAMARKQVGAGRFGLRGMLSLEPFTIVGCGYPDLLATGEQCEGDQIHDQQHPHDLFMELAAEYDRPLRGSWRWQVYGGFAGEPALGPVAYPHRISALPNPLAPIGHHWLDATHITFGVVTAGVYDAKWKAEGSVFNGREPDERRTDLNLAALDSFSGRIWFAPAPSWNFQVSAGRLNEAEAGHAADEPRRSVTRVTASATVHRAFRADSIAAATLTWGRNAESDEATHAFLAEGNLTLSERHVWFGRFEVGGKPAHDLDVHDSDEVFTAAKIQAGYTRLLPAWHQLRPGFGVTGSVSIVPTSLAHEYGRRANPGVGFFVTLRPGTHSM